MSNRITMMKSNLHTNEVCGNVVIDGTEYAVKWFKVASDASARDKENELLKRAIKEHEGKDCE